jgi:hypothetical protein
MLRVFTKEVISREVDKLKVVSNYIVSFIIKEDNSSEWG